MNTKVSKTDQMKQITLITGQIRFIQARFGSNTLKSDKQKSILVIGDSMIKHIDPNKLSCRTVRKFTCRGKTCEEISEAVDDIQTTTNPSHIIYNCIWYNLSTHRFC